MTTVYDDVDNLELDTLQNYRKIIRVLTSEDNRIQVGDNVIRTMIQFEQVMESEQTRFFPMIFQCTQRVCLKKLNQGKRLAFRFNKRSTCMRRPTI